MWPQWLTQYVTLQFQDCFHPLENLLLLHKIKILSYSPVWSLCWLMHVTISCWQCIVCHPCDRLFNSARLFIEEWRSKYFSLCRISALLVLSHFGWQLVGPIQHGSTACLVSYGRGINERWHWQTNVSSLWNFITVTFHLIFKSVLQLCMASPMDFWSFYFCICGRHGIDRQTKRWGWSSLKQHDIN